MVVWDDKNTMRKFIIPQNVFNLVNGIEIKNRNNRFFDKLNPHDGKTICKVLASGKEEVDAAVKVVRRVQVDWVNIPAVKRGEVLFEIANLMDEYKNDMAKVVALETGKSMKDALGETGGAIQLTRFFAGEGQRLYGRTTTSGVVNKYAMTIRESVGVCALIVAANTPIANIAWKVFPALICGNSVVLKSSKDAPATAWVFGEICKKSSLPAGVLNIIHGSGEVTGEALIQHPDINLISFTGSTAVGKHIAEVAGKRLVKISLELGGKNPLVVCDDADLENAAHWVLLSAFSNAGQRCASGSRIIVFDAIYEKFKKMLNEKTKKLKIGIADTDDFGPVINEKQLNNMLAVVMRAKKSGAKILVGGERLQDATHKNGFYMAPTIIEDAKIHDEISVTELFGPIACLYHAKNFQEALSLANDSPYGLTSCIHTTNINRALEFVHRVHAGVAVVNGGTYGSEPHMPFGGVKNSGNGTREPGTEALDVYSNIKDMYEFVSPENT